MDATWKNLEKIHAKEWKGQTNQPSEFMQEHFINCTIPDKYRGK